jgi:hypothetical protein
MLRFGSQTIQVLHAVLRPTGAAGRFQRDWSTATDTYYNYCGFQPLSTTEYIDDREFAETHWKCIFPGRAQVFAEDRVVWGGNTYEVDGDPEFWEDMWGRDHHTTILVKRWVG